jgi:UPA domain
MITGYCVAWLVTRYLCVQGVEQVEHHLGGRLLTKPRQFQFQFGGSNLSLAINNLGAGWRSKVPDNYQVWKAESV